MIKLFEKHEIITPHNLRFASRLERFLWVVRRGSERSGLYTLGHGDKAIIWYWELDTDTKEFYQFFTLDLPLAMKIYQEQKLKIWEEDWGLEPPNLTLKCYEDSVQEMDFDGAVVF